MKQIKFSLSSNEKQILETLWRENKSLTRSQLIDLTHNKTWEKGSIHVLLNQLLNKNAIEVDNIIKTGKSYGRTYKPTLTKEQYELMQLSNVFKEINPSKASLKNFFSALVESEVLEDNTLEELENLIKQHKRDCK